MLTGGSAVRFQGADKASIEIAGVTLLEHVLGALAEVPEVVVVGDEVLASRPVGFAREDPPGGGPAAGLLAGLDAFPTPAAPGGGAGRGHAAGHHGHGATADARGRRRRGPARRRGRARQYLCAIYRAEALRAAAPPLEDRHGLPMRRLLSDLRLAEVPALAWEARDVDTWEDLRELRERLDG